VTGAFRIEHQSVDLDVGGYLLSLDLPEPPH